MNSLITSLLDLDSVEPTVVRAKFSELELEDVAQAIIELGGLLRPITVKRTGIEETEIVTGNFEYWAMVKATEINPNLEQKIRAFIIEPGQEEKVKKQLLLLDRLAW